MDGVRATIPYLRPVPMMSPRRLLHTLALAALGCAVAPGAALAQAPVGVVTGRVTDKGTGLPVPSAQVMVAGGSSATLTNADGLYTLRNVPAGAATVRTLRIGYAETRQQTTVVARQTVTLNFEITPVPASLSAVVTTATGNQRRVEVGNAIAQVSASEITAKATITNVGDLLNARAAGVDVFGATQPGAGIRIRIRGTSSMALSNNPIFVIDGIRVDASTGSSTVSVGGTLPSRIGDLNPEEIETLEIVRGPSAATLYGTDAANGVIVITTKRGVAGRPQWTYYTEQSAVQDRNDYPSAYRGWRTGTTSSTNSTVANTVQCFLTQVAAGVCKQDSLTTFNPVKDKETTPFGTAYRYQHGLQVRGGSEAIRYFLMTEVENEDGVTKVPEFEKRYMAAHAITLLPEQANPGATTKFSTRANLNIALSPQADVAVNSGYISQLIRLPRSDDAGTAGIAANIYGGPGLKYNTNTAGDTLWGWREFTPRTVYQATTTQNIERFINSISANWRPRSWIATRANAGLDYISRTDKQICRFQNCPNIGTDRQGFKIDNRTNFFTYTVDGSATANRTLTSTIESKTTAGVQFYRSVFDRNGATGLVLPPGATQVTAAATAQADESTSESRTLGGYVEQNLAFRDRVFVTGALRSDRNSAFGANFKTVFYPKLSVSWVLSDESFFKADWVNQLRLRTAYGASGVQPGTTDAVQYYSATSWTGESGDAPAVVFTALGNRNLKPERSAESELGIDGTFWSSRLITELTYFSKVSTDALISRVLPPSLGTGATARLENLGKVTNSGLEAMMTLEVIKTDGFNWDLNLNGTTTSNKLVSLSGQPNIVVSSTQQHRQGYPLYGWWARGLLSYADKNGNGIIEYNADPNLSELTVSDTAIYHGNALPKYELRMTNGFEFWKRRLRLQALVDYKGGYLIYNNTERIRCASRLNCQSLFTKDASLADQARTVMVREHPAKSTAGFFEPGDFIRLRELSITGDLPERWARRAFSRSVQATFSIRNVAMLWTKYTGLDPEAFGTTGDAPSSFQAFGPPTYAAFRISFGF